MNQTMHMTSSLPHRSRSVLFSLLALLLLILTQPSHAKDRIRYHINGPDGSTLRVVDAKGIAVESYRYAPFGEQLTSKRPHNLHGQQGFVGGIHESNDLVYLKHRYYNPRIGRFYQPDPVTFLSGGMGQINRYQYGWNDPLTFKDPSGLVIVTVGSPDFKKDVADVIEFSREKGISQYFDLLEQDSRLFYITSVETKSSFVREGSIFWNSRMAYETSPNIFISPATALAHESFHLVMSAFNPDLHEKTRNTYDPQYQRASERAAIVTIEQDFARALGEITSEQTTRVNHKVISYFPVNSPFSNKR